MESRRSKENRDASHLLKGVHVCEVYLARRQLTDVPDLSRFNQLRYIWLNNNRIRHVHSPAFHCSLAELYLQNNEISSIAGVLRHLRCLRVLFLHNNHLHNLEETVAELRNMQHLQTLKVRQEERRRAFKLLRPDRQSVLDAVAFDRRALVERKMMQDTQRGPWSSKTKRTKCPFDEIEDLCERRAMQRSIMQFSTLAWSSIGRLQQHPLEEEKSTAATILTVKFR